VIICGNPRLENPNSLENSENVIDLLFSKTPPAKLRQDTIMADGSWLRSLVWFTGPDSNNVVSPPTQKDAPCNGVRTSVDSSIKPFPVLVLLLPYFRVRQDQLGVAHLSVRSPAYWDSDEVATSM
jgi:hypothetical protein